MNQSFEDIRAEIEQAPLATEEQAEQFRIRFLGRKSGVLTGLFDRIKEVPPAERRMFGQTVNALKQLAESRLEDARAQLESRSDGHASDLDLTLPGREQVRGSIHPISRTWDEIFGIFHAFGFGVAEGPEIEDDWHNFTALNFPPDHPARDMQDTFFIEPPPPDGRGILLRTHTSPVQIRVMKAQQPPIRLLVPGRVYRNEAISYKSFCLFNQVEGLVVDRGITFADLKQVLHVFAQSIFGDDVRMRFRPSFFPFTEPSAEVDIWWPDADDPTGEKGRWMEILGCGMVHPAVFEQVGVDPEVYTGYAFGMGIDRVAMLKYGISDIRILYENDVRFLEQF